MYKVKNAFRRIHQSQLGYGLEIGIGLLILSACGGTPRRQAEALAPAPPPAGAEQIALTLRPMVVAASQKDQAQPDFGKILVEPEEENFVVQRDEIHFKRPVYVPIVLKGVAPTGKETAVPIFLAWPDVIDGQTISSATYFAEREDVRRQLVRSDWTHVASREGDRFYLNLLDIVGMGGALNPAQVDPTAKYFVGLDLSLPGERKVRVRLQFQAVRSAPYVSLTAPREWVQYGSLDAFRSALADQAGVGAEQTISNRSYSPAAVWVRSSADFELGYVTTIHSYRGHTHAPPDPETLYHRRAYRTSRFQLAVRQEPTGEAIPLRDVGQGWLRFELPMGATARIQWILKGPRGTGMCNISPPMDVTHSWIEYRRVGRGGEGDDQPVMVSRAYRHWYEFSGLTVAGSVQESLRVTDSFTPFEIATQADYPTERVQEYARGTYRFRKDMGTQPTKYDESTCDGFLP
ncbi:MAG: hypothetical protein AB7F66_04390 [Bacteriovoracia bacterium]